MVEGVTNAVVHECHDTAHNDCLERDSMQGSRAAGDVLPVSDENASELLGDAHVTAVAHLVDLRGDVVKLLTALIDLVINHCPEFLLVSLLKYFV